MEKEVLKSFEQRCIQEELPYCQAACPLKVDGRSFCAAMAEGRFDEARRVLSRSMAFPDILGRICDHPCEDACVMSKRGGAVALGKLERACLERSEESGPPLRLPSTGMKAAVFGGGLSSLFCAFELLKKGHRVFLCFVGEVPGGRLLGLPEEILPRKILGKALATLEAMGATRLHGDIPVEIGSREWAVAYVGVDDPRWEDFVSRKEIDPLTYETTSPGVFAGGYAREGKVSPVWESADGKRAANSMDRFLQGASLTSGREKETTLETRLFTPLETVPYLPPRDDPVGEAKRCILCECRYCVRECSFLEKYKRYPKAYAREIYNNFAIVKGVHQANKMINSCALCGLCEALCPNDFSMADLCRSSREEMVEKGIMPPSVHEFALLDMDHANSPRAAGLRPGEEGTKALFFPGCQLAGTMPEHTDRLFEHLKGVYQGELGLLLGCCGAPAWWSGRKTSLEKVLGRVEGALRSVGNPPLILACSSCNEVFRHFLPDVERVSVWQVLLDKGFPPTGQPRDMTLALHDPCTTRREPGWRDPVRELLGAIGQSFEELPFGGETTRCCGYGGLQYMADPELARKSVNRRLEESENPFLTYCSMCRESLSGHGKDVFHILDLLFNTPPREDRTGFSQRRANREALRRDLLGPSDLPPEPWDDLDISISQTVRECLEERHILESDIRQTLWKSSLQGRYLFSSKGTRLASSRIGNVTFWVEYLPLEEALEIINAWSHRMTLELTE